MECDHADLELIGEQRTVGGVNKYFICKKCKGVLIIPPEGDKVYYIKPVKGE